MNTELPSKTAEVAQNYPTLWQAYSALGKACAESGPLKGEALRLVKLALQSARHRKGGTFACKAGDIGRHIEGSTEASRLAFSADTRFSARRSSLKLDRGVAS